MGRRAATALLASLADGIAIASVVLPLDLIVRG